MTFIRNNLLPQVEEESPDIFLSYQWGKQPQIKALYKKLTEMGFSCWMDIYQMGGGDSLYDKIDRGVRGCRIVVTMVTPKYSLSANCRREVSLADALKKPVIPLLLEKMDWPPAGPMSMVFTQLLYIDFTKDPNIQLNWAGSKFEEFHAKIIEKAPELSIEEPPKDQNSKQAAAPKAKPTSADKKDPKSQQSEKDSKAKPTAADKKDLKPTAADKKDPKPTAADKKDPKPTAADKKDPKSTAADKKDPKPAAVKKDPKSQQSEKDSKAKPTAADKKDLKPTAADKKDPKPTAAVKKDPKSQQSEKDPKPAASNKKSVSETKDPKTPPAGKNQKSNQGTGNVKPAGNKSTATKPKGAKDSKESANNAPKETPNDSSAKPENNKSSSCSLL